MNIRRGFFRLWLIASVAWVLVATVATWKELFWPSFAEGNYLYLLEGWPTPKGVTNKFFDAELGTTVYRDGKAQGQFRELEPGDQIADYSKIDFPHNLVLWMPATLDQAGQKEMVEKFATTYFESRVSEASERRLASLGAILVPPLAVLVIGAALLWAFSGFRKT